MSWFVKISLLLTVVLPTMSFGLPEGEDFPFKCDNKNRTLNINLVPNGFGYKLQIHRDWFNAIQLPTYVFDTPKESLFQIKAETSEPLFYMRVQGYISTDPRTPTKIKLFEGFEKSTSTVSEFTCNGF